MAATVAASGSQLRERRNPNYARACTLLYTVLREILAKLHACWFTLSEGRGSREGRNGNSDGLKKKHVESRIHDNRSNARRIFEILNRFEYDSKSKDF